MNDPTYEWKMAGIKGRAVRVVGVALRFVRNMDSIRCSGYVAVETDGLTPNFFIMAVSAPESWRATWRKVWRTLQVLLIVGILSSSIKSSSPTFTSFWKLHRWKYETPE